MVHIIIDGLLSGTVKDIPPILDELFPNWKFVEESYTKTSNGWKCNFTDAKGSYTIVCHNVN